MNYSAVNQATSDKSGTGHRAQGTGISLAGRASRAGLAGLLQ